MTDIKSMTEAELTAYCKALGQPAFRAKAVDTTAAGDSFNAGFAAGLAMGMDLKRAVRLGNAAGALAVTAFGAQDGMPSLEQAEKLISEQWIENKR